jgi:hypothetical protein
MADLPLDASTLPRCIVREPLPKREWQQAILTEIPRNKIQGDHPFPSSIHFVAPARVS